jgi:glycerol transport system permease protein
MTSQATTANTIQTSAASSVGSKAGASSKRSISWLVPTLYILFLMLPIYWLVNMSFKTNAEITGAFSLWPVNPTLRNYTVIFTDPAWYSGYINSIIYVVLNTVISVSVALPAAYAF